MKLINIFKSSTKKKFFDIKKKSNELEIWKFETIIFRKEKEIDKYF